MANKMSTWDRIQWNPLVPGACLTWWIWRMNTWEWEMNWFRFIGFVVICGWFLGAMANWITRGRFLEWMTPDEEDSEFKLPTSFTEFLRLTKNNSPLITALHTGISEPAKLEEALENASVTSVGSERDAIAVATAFQDLSRADSPHAPHVLDLFRVPGSQVAYSCFCQVGMPLVHERLKALKGRAKEAPGFDDEELKSIALLVMYAYRPAFADISDRARDPRLVDSYMWVRIFEAGVVEDDDFLELLSHMGKKLPLGFACVALLDRCNELCLHEKLKPHPFSSAAGIQRLEEYIKDQDPEHYSYAVSAASALPHLAHPDVESLLVLGSRHPHPNVVVETAWAGAKLGRESSIQLLADLSKDWRTGRRAMAFLREMNLENRIPVEALDGRHVAICTVADWLQHPNELARFPDTLEVVDHRTIFWPPSEEMTCVSLIRWTLDDEAGIAMTGGTTTWCFFSKDLSDWPHLDIYAQHCNWEMRANEFPDAPADYTNLSFGRDLLQKMNPLEKW